MRKAAWVELGAPAAITGGIAEALLATAFGLGIAMSALIPFNYLTAKQEEARGELEEAATELHLALARAPGSSELGPRAGVAT